MMDSGVWEVVATARRKAIIALITLPSNEIVPSNIRDDVDYAFLFREDCPVNRGRLFRNYASTVLPSMSVFDRLMDGVADDHACLVVDKRARRVFRYTANHHPPRFRMCPDEVWDWCKANLEPSESSDDDDDDDDDVPRYPNASVATAPPRCSSLGRTTPTSAPSEPRSAFREIARTLLGWVGACRPHTPCKKYSRR